MREILYRGCEKMERLRQNSTFKLEEYDKFVASVKVGDLVVFPRQRSVSADENNGKRGVRLFKYDHWGVVVSVNSDGKVGVVHRMLDTVHHDQDARSLIDPINQIVKIDNSGDSLPRNQPFTNNQNNIGARAANTALELFHYFTESEIDEYSLFRHNCEHFATYCRYGRGYCLQPPKLVRGMDVTLPVPTGIQGRIG